MTRCRFGGEGGHTSRSTPQGPRGSRGALTRALCVSILLLFALGPVLLLPPTIGESIDAPQTRAALAPKEPAHGFFIENRGQLSSEVRFYSLGSVDVGFRDDGVMFVAPDGDGIAAYLVRFDGANAVAPVGRDMLPFRTNYFLGNDPGGWRTDVPAYGEVAYPNLYEGIDLVYRPSSGGVKYEFSVHPGADPSTIRMRYEGVSSLAVEGGGLSIRMIRGVVRDSAPSSYERGGKEVSCPLVMRNPLTVGFACADRDRRHELTIDPVTLLYSTFLGGRANDVGYGLAVDGAGAAYIVGSTDSPDFPSTPGSYNGSYLGPSDGFVVKLTPDGSTLAYATFLGGAGGDYAFKVAVDAAGNAVVTGSTYSTDFPVTAGAFQPALRGGEDSYVTKLNSAGNALVYSTFLGGSSADNGGPVVIGPNGAAIVAGHTLSTDFPTTPNAMQRGWHGGGSDAFVAKFGPTGTVGYVTYLGGGGEDWAMGAAADGGGNAYLAGYTNSVNFTVTVGSFSNASHGSNDAFVIKLNSIGFPVYSTYLGGPSDDIGYGIAVDVRGNAYVGGRTGGGFPTTPGAFASAYNGGLEDGYVAKLNASGTGLVYSTYLGGSATDHGGSIAVDAAGFAHVALKTTSTDYPVTPDALFATMNGNYDVAVTILNATGRSLAYSTYLGGSGVEQARGLGIGPTGETYVGGFTASSDFPTTPGAFNPVYRGGLEDAFVAKIGTPAYPVLADLTVPSARITFNPPGPVDTGTAVTIRALVRNEGWANGLNVSVRFHDGLPSPSNRIGVDQTVPLVPRYSGQAATTNSWITGAPGTHLICVVADPDNAIPELDETNNMGCAPIEVLAGPPLTALVVGTPNVTTTLTYVTSATLFSFSVVDPSGTGIRDTTYRIDGGAWVNYTATGPFHLLSEGTHDLEWLSEDNIGHVENTSSRLVGVDNTPPAVTVGVGTPKYVDGSTLYVTAMAPVSLSSEDRGVTPVGPATLEYRLDGGTWTAYTTPLHLSGGDGVHVLDHRAADLLGNAANGTFNLVLDDTPPETAIAPSSGSEPVGTTFALNATDDGSGVGGIEYRIDGGGWTPYTDSFALDVGSHLIGYRSSDHLGNTEIERTLAVTVTAPASPPGAPTSNLKPLVAAVFAAILILVGAWSARRAPWPTGSRRRLRAFAISALPFVVAEAATGVVSRVTGLLAIPPLLGAGTAVDLGILIAGIIAAAIRVRRRRGQTASSSRVLVAQVGEGITRPD